MNKFLFSLVIVFSLSTAAFGQERYAQYLQDISVTISSKNSSGSGVLITRDIRLNKDQDKVAKVNFVLTAAHVVDNLREVKTVVDPSTGMEKKVIEYGPVFIVKELTEDGRRVGETRMEGRVIKYSDADSRHDLAVIMLHKRNFVDVSTRFYLDDDIPGIGTNLLHVGSLLGQLGSNSMTTGIVSQVGRVVNFGSNSIVFDQTTTTAFPGSSGGGVFLSKDARYVGMVVRGAGETFNLIAPIRRIKEFAGQSKLMWLLDEDIDPPTLEEIMNMPIDDVKTKSDSNNRAAQEAAKAPGKPVEVNTLEHRNE
jgi:S1-C subfamily serine protease